MELSASEAWKESEKCRFLEKTGNFPIYLQKKNDKKSVLGSFWAGIISDFIIHAKILGGFSEFRGFEGLTQPKIAPEGL